MNFTKLDHFLSCTTKLETISPFVFHVNDRMFTYYGQNIINYAQLQTEVIEELYSSIVEIKQKEITLYFEMILKRIELSLKDKNLAFSAPDIFDQETDDGRSRFEEFSKSTWENKDEIRRIKKFGFPLFIKSVNKKKRIEIIEDLAIELRNSMLRILISSRDSSESQESETVEFDSYAQKIAWLYELGIVELILQKTSVGKDFNVRRAANVISSFTGMPIETVRQCLAAIVSENPASMKNNPLKNSNNIIFVQELLRKFKIAEKK